MAKINAEARLAELKYDPLEELVNTAQKIDAEYALAEDSGTKANLLRTKVDIDKTLLTYTHAKPGTYANKKKDDEKEEKKSHADILKVIEEAEKEKAQE